MEISEKLLCLFSAEVTGDGDRYTVEIPRREIETGSVDPGETYRVALIADDAEVGERVKIEITEVKSNFAVGEIIE